MKKITNSTSKIALLSLGLLFAGNAFSQNAKEIAEITKEYDLPKIKKLEISYARKAQIEKDKALAAAAINNWPVFKKNADGSVDELMKLTPDGFPIYFSVQNVNAAKSTRANILNTVYNVNGEGMVARIWDGGKVRASHQEFATGRVTVVDDVAGPNGNNFHSTHVTGTVIAAGVDPAAKGMASLASARTFNWTNDESEALSEVQMGMLLSNHSYGVPSTSVPGFYIGAYVDESRAWDEIAYVSPYYLMVASAGNNGLDNNTSALSPGYDKLTGNKVSKNNLVIANAQDANVTADGTLVSVAINSSSSQGPADDLRIKPDITGNGTNLYSTYDNSDTAYNTISGTSMASPNVMGTLLLMQQLYKNKNQHFMKAATLKALACHTADDAGNFGPDAKFGWGLLNGKAAGETIVNAGLSSIITEEDLVQGQTYTLTVKAKTGQQLKATLVWTDAPGAVSTGVLNDFTPALVNDLDLRVKRGTTVYYPWRLQADATENALNDGDNAVDNVERVDVFNGNGTYVITVTHKGDLVGGQQHFSLIVTGIDSKFALTSTSPDLAVCSTDSAAYSFDYTTTTTEATNLAVSGLPTGATAVVSVNSITAAGPVQVTISNLQNVAPGDYVIKLTGTNSTESEIKNIALRVYTSSFQNVTQQSPTNSAFGLASTVNFKWAPIFNAEQYRLQVATDASFSTLLVNELTTNTSFLSDSFAQATRYYWRVLPVNRCGSATSGTVFKFDTGIQNCGNTFTATDFSNATIASDNPSFASVPITVSGGMTVGNITVNLNLTHTYIEDTSIFLEGPASIGSPIITLFREPCGDNDNINCTLSDSGNVFTCANSAPSISGTVKPNEPLSNFNNLAADGVWTLYVDDNYAGDGGVINSASLNFCNVTNANLSIQDELLAKISVYPNPTKGFVNVNLPQTNEETTLHLFDIQGRKISSKTTRNTTEILNIENLQEGIYILSIENGTYQTTKKIILHK